MKTVLFIDSSGSRYFQRSGGQWRPVAGPSRQDTLWVLVNLPDESLEVVDLPPLHGRDRSNLLERRLAGVFPESNCRSYHLLSGGFFTPGKAMLTGLTAAKEIVNRLAALETTVVGLWGIAALLTMMVKRIGTPDVLVVLQGTLALRILVFKNWIPVLTRHVQVNGGSFVDEILLTRNYLKNQQIFERGRPLPVLFLGDASIVAAPLAKTGLNLLPVPKEFLPQGEAGWLHPFFNRIISSPACQLAPLPLRAKYLASNVRRAAYAGICLSLGAGAYFAQADIRAVIELHEQAQLVQTEVQRVELERERLSALIQKSGADPELVRRATRFEAQEMAVAPSGDAFLPLAAAAIAAVPEVRLQSLAFHLSANGESVCQYKKKDLPAAPGAHDAAAESLRLAEIQLIIILPASLSPQAKTEARKRISAALQGVAGVKLLHDPVFAARQAILKGGAGVDTGQIEEHWCFTVPWQKSEVERLAGKGTL